VVDGAFYLHHDQTGSTRLTTSTTGATLSTASYDPYGNLMSSTGTQPLLGYQGQLADPATGLIYLRARWYDPTTAQFLTQDPLQVLTQEPYAYAGDNPINEADPTGLCSVADDLTGLCTLGNTVSGAFNSVVNTIVNHPGQSAEAADGVGCVAGLQPELCVAASLLAVPVHGVGLVTAAPAALGLGDRVGRQ
jgi:RHS repeat-associated protein